MKESRDARESKKREERGIGSRHLQREKAEDLWANRAAANCDINAND